MNDFPSECDALSNAYFGRLRALAPLPPRYVDTSALPNTDVHVSRLDSERGALRNVTSAAPPGLAAPTAAPAGATPMRQGGGERGVP